ncbi:hypothetical protein HC725_04240 [Vibrio sp. S17_S38]|uniref:hypothetical protein n=1 Tax=Vibrio sp. S17_S38 TaxID=2720229 RepID=UPI001680D139|nr:hypothetical protein [Vibrio sp. S17_S38]MBD1572487.1 hypothetical protein [Vibrio sp. S17_S38]
MRVRKLEIVASGIQKNGKAVTKEMLESVVRNYKADSRPPVTPGHPTKGSDQIAALGRVSNLRTEQATDKTILVGEVVYTPEMEKREDSGEFEGFSAGIHPVIGQDGEWHMHHLAFLGQLPPAADIKTRDVVNLSDSDFSDDVIYLSASVGNQAGQSKQTEETGLPMDEEKLKGLLKGVLKEELAEMGIKPNTPANKDGEPDADKGKPSGEGKPDSEVTALKESMAGDRKESLTELADSREMSDDLRTSIKAMIDDASVIELCATGETSHFKKLKNMISALPEKKAAAPQSPSFNALTQALELSNDGQQKDTFNPEGW